MDSFFRLHPADEAKLDALLVLMHRIERRVIAMAIQGQPLMKDISDILRAVTAETSLATAAALALQAANQHLSDAQAQIVTLQAQVEANALDPVQVQTLLDTVATASAQLSAAIPANTSAALPPVVDQPVVAGTAAGGAAPAVAVGTGVARTDAPGTVSAATESQAADPLANVPAVPAAADTVPVAAVVPAADTVVP